MLYRICLKKHSMVGEKMISFDHWVSVNAKNEWEAKEKAKHKIAWQLLNGDSYGNNWEPIMVFTHMTLNNIKADIDITDLEIGK